MDNQETNLTLDDFDTEPEITSTIEWSSNNTYPINGVRYLGVDPFEFPEELAANDTYISAEQGHVYQVTALPLVSPALDNLSISQQIILACRDPYEWINSFVFMFDSWLYSTNEDLKDKRVSSVALRIIIRNFRSCIPYSIDSEYSNQIFYWKEFVTYMRRLRLYESRVKARLRD